MFGLIWPLTSLRLSFTADSSRSDAAFVFMHLKKTFFDLCPIFHFGHSASTKLSSRSTVSSLRQEVRRWSVSPCYTLSLPSLSQLQFKPWLTSQLCSPAPLFTTAPYSETGGQKQAATHAHASPGAPVEPEVERGWKNLASRPATSFKLLVM